MARSRARRKKAAPKTRKESWDLAKSAARKVVGTQLEKHYFDFSQITTVTTSATIWALSLVTVGNTDLTRSGDRITIKSLQVKGTYSAGDTTNHLRVICFQYIADSGAAGPVASEVLQSSFVGSVNIINAPYAKDFAGYKTIILYDKTFSMTLGANADGGPANGHFQFMLTSKDFKKGKANPMIQYQAGGTNGVGNIYLMAMSDSAGVPNVGIDFVSRLRFIDN